MAGPPGSPVCTYNTNKKDKETIVLLQAKKEVIYTGSGKITLKTSKNTLGY